MYTLRGNCTFFLDCTFRFVHFKRPVIKIIFQFSIIWLHAKYFSKSYNSFKGYSRHFRYGILTSNISKFSVFSNFVWRSGTARTSIDIYNGLLSHIQPNNGSIFWPFFTTSLLDSGSKSVNCRLTATVNFVAGHASEIGDSLDLVFEFLNFLKVVLEKKWHYKISCNTRRRGIKIEIK